MFLFQFIHKAAEVRGVFKKHHAPGDASVMRSSKLFSSRVVVAVFSAGLAVTQATAGPQSVDGMPAQSGLAEKDPTDVESSDFALLLSRLRAQYLQTGARQASSAMASLNEKGEWADILYEDRGVGAWKPMEHLDRVRAMAVAYAAATGEYSRSIAVRDGIERALRAWLVRQPRSENWWHNTIGVQLTLMPVLVLMGADLPDDLRSALLAKLEPLSALPADRKTGQNLVWYATQQVVRGALTRNRSDVLAGRDAIRSVLAFTTAEGLQVDHSFHQHGNQLYSGGYGLAFLVDSVRVADWLEGTAWRFPDADLKQLADFATIGIGPLARGDWLDWSARGREITRQSSISAPSLLLGAVSSLVVLVPERRVELEALQSRLTNRTGPGQTNTHGYWRSDFLVHQTPNGYFSVKMVSSRTVGTESGNGENKLGYWLPFGSTFIVGKGSGSEYLGLQPLFDWSALPGITAPQMVPRFTGYLRHPEDRVAVLSGPRDGMASMQVNTHGLQAKKFWFFDGDMMVALGTDILYPGEQSVRTTLNQTRWAGHAESSAGALPDGNTTQGGIKWLVHGGVGYVLLDEQRATLSVDQRQLRTADPTTTVFGAQPSTAAAAQIVTLSINHGVRPQGASYAYAVVHGVDGPSQLQGSARPRVLINSSRAQGVMSADGEGFAMAFHQPGRFELGRGQFLQANAAVAVLGRMAGQRMLLQVIDLAGKGGAVTLSTFNNDQLLERQTVSVPTNAQRSSQKPAATISLLIAPALPL